MTPTSPDTLQPDHVTAASQRDALTADRLLASAMAFWQSAVLLSANEIGLFAELAAGPRDAVSIERCLGLREDATADLLDALVALGLVERSGAHYRNTPEASLFLDPAKPSYIGHWLAMASAAMREMADLTTQLRAARADEQQYSLRADPMWADIAALLRAARTQDG